MIVFGSTFAQRNSIGIKYTGLISSRNYKSASLYSLEGNHKFKNYRISLGANIALLVGTVYANSINEPPPDAISELTFAVGVTVKYFPVNFESIYFIKPFVGIDIGYYFPSDNLYMAGMNIECEKDYNFNSSYDFYTNFNAGLIFNPQGKLNVVLNLAYLFRSPKVTYEKFINCHTEKPLTIVEYSESINLSMFLWSIGVQLNL